MQAVIGSRYSKLLIPISFYMYKDGSRRIRVDLCFRLRMVCSAVSRAPLFNSKAPLYQRPPGHSLKRVGQR